MGVSDEPAGIHRIRVESHANRTTARQTATHGRPGRGSDPKAPHAAGANSNQQHGLVPTRAGPTIAHRAKSHSRAPNGYTRPAGEGRHPQGTARPVQMPTSARHANAGAATPTARPPAPRRHKLTVSGETHNPARERDSISEYTPAKCHNRYNTAIHTHAHTHTQPHTHTRVRGETE